MFTKRQRRSRRSYRRNWTVFGKHPTDRTTGHVRGVCVGDKCPWHGRK